MASCPASSHLRGRPGDRPPGWRRRAGSRARGKAASPSTGTATARRSRDSSSPRALGTASFTRHRRRASARAEQRTSRGGSSRSGGRSGPMSRPRAAPSTSTPMRRPRANPQPASHVADVEIQIRRSRRKRPNERRACHRHHRRVAIQQRAKQPPRQPPTRAPPGGRGRGAVEGRETEVREGDAGRQRPGRDGGGSAVEVMDAGGAFSQAHTRRLAPIRCLARKRMAAGPALLPERAGDHRAPGRGPSAYPLKSHSPDML